MSEPRQIKVLAGYPSNNTLKLSDGGESWLEKGTKIEWLIENQSPVEPGTVKVVSLVEIVIRKGNNPDEIFEDKPKKEGEKFKAKLKSDDGVKSKQCKYDIHWIGEDIEDPRIYDPIIAVLPKPLIPTENEK